MVGAELSGNILVVEDDDHLRDVLARGLREQGHSVATARDGESAMRADLSSVDAVVLDIGLPDSDGRDVCQAIRARGFDKPVLLLTARRGETDRLAGFAVGADDYLAKPFSFPELVARIGVMLRRSGGREQTRWTDLHVDPLRHALVSDRGTVELSPTEFRLLARLLADPTAVVRRRQLVEAGWPVGGIVSDNTLDQYVSRLRRKITQSGSQRTIAVVRGVGYRIA